MTTSELESPPVESVSGALDRGSAPLRYFCFYRIVISGLFAVLGIFAKLPPNFTEFNVRQFALTASIYFVLSIIALVALEGRWARTRFQVYAQVLLDIAAFTLFIRASGGVGGGFGILLVVAIAGGCLFVKPKAAIFFASLATLAVLGETMLGSWNLYYPNASYTRAGLLGIVLFGTALLSSILAERARRSEALAAKRGIDIEYLSQVNEHIVQRMRSGIVVFDDAHNPVLANAAARSMFSDRVGSEADDDIAIPRSLELAYKKWIADETNSKLPLELDSQSLEVIASFTHLGAGGAGGTLLFLEDAAEMRQRAQQLKLASLGRLTGSIAHEIRNPLGAISAAGQLLSESPELSEQDRRLTDIIDDHSQRVNLIIENVMTIGRRKLAIAESFEFRPWLEEFLAELKERKQLTDADVRCVWLDAELMVRMDKSQLHQVLWNLCENALRYSTIAPYLSFICGRAGGSARPYIDIVDNGPGMSEKVAEQVFEPFYTGEATGTGLGLYIARELCESNQASLVLAAHDSRGCCFRINFAHPDRRQLTE